MFAWYGGCWLVWMKIHPSHDNRSAEWFKQTGEMRANWLDLLGCVERVGGLVVYFKKAKPKNCPKTIVGISIFKKITIPSPPYQTTTA
jgi:hypothetical protein